MELCEEIPKIPYNSIDENVSIQVEDREQKEDGTVHLKKINAKRLQIKSDNCEFCGHKAKNFFALQIHVQMNHMNISYQCKICEYKLKERSLSKKHIVTTHDMKQEDIGAYFLIACGICENVGNEKENKEHISMMHPEYNLYWNGRGPKNYKCPHCIADFTNNSLARATNLSQHLQRVHIRSVYSCGECSFTSKSRLTFTYHVEQIHSLTRNPEKSIIFKCHACEFKVAGCKKKLMHDHMKTNHKEMLTDLRVSCQDCDYQGNSRKELKIHKSEKHPGELYMNVKCPKCKYEASNHSNLMTHLLWHVNTLYFCKLCNYSIGSRPKLKIHFTNNHEKEFQASGWIKNYVAWKCGTCKFEGEAKEYGAHMIRQHELPPTNKKYNKTRKYQRTTTNKNIVSEKGKIELGTQNFICHMCKFSYNLAGNLRVHMHKKHLRSSYVCKLCDKTSNTRGILVNHFRDDHRDIVESEPKGFIEKYITCCCKPCAMQTSSKPFDDHLFKIHSFPERQDHKIKTKTRRIVKKETTNFLEYKNMRARKDVELILKKAKLPLKLKLKACSSSEKQEGISEKNGQIQANTTANIFQENPEEKCNSAIQKDGNTGNNEKIPTKQGEEGTVRKNEFECPTCIFSTYKNKFILRNHMHLNHTGSFYSCNMCQFKSTRKKIVFNHFLSHYSAEVEVGSREWLIKNLSCHCKSCNVKFTSSEFEDHLVSIHKFPILKRYFYTDRTNVWRCPSCKGVLRKSDMFQHISEKHLNVHYNCNICDIKVITIHGLKEHVETVHSGISSSSTYCEKCDITIQDNGDLRHLNTIHKDLLRQANHNNYSELFLILGKCKFCQSDTTSYEIERHILRDHLNMQYQCKQCLFVDNKTIRTHMTVSHKNSGTDILQLSCGLCNKKFERKNIVGHIGSHENDLLEAVYAYTKCNKCSFQTISKRSLNTHKVKAHQTAIHDCPVCEMKTTSKQKLVDHVKNEHPDYRYTCYIPGCTTKLKSKHYAALIRHRNEIHETKTFFNCSWCPLRYKRYEYLTVHKENDHNADGTFKQKSSRWYPIARPKKSQDSNQNRNNKVIEPIKIKRRRLLNRSK